LLGYNESEPLNSVDQTAYISSISTTYKGTNLLGYNESEPLNSVDQTAYISSMLSSTQHKFKIPRINYFHKSET
jgi:hypothetical protein